MSSTRVCCVERKTRSTATSKQTSKTKCTEQLPKLGYYVYGAGGTKAQLRPKYRAGVKPTGIGDYYNMMWDPHVYRGQTFKTFQEVEIERKNVSEKGPKKKWKRPQRKLGGIDIPQTPPPAEGHQRDIVATDKFLIEFEINVEELDATTQTDVFDEVPPKPIYVASKSGYDVGTQMCAEELYHFEEEVTPVIETVAWKVLEQSLLEFTEEEELRQLSAEQMYYEERRRLEALRIKHLADREQQMHAERAALMELMKTQREDEKDAEYRIGAYLFSCSYLKELLPKCLENLTDEGFLNNMDLAKITALFRPWLAAEVTHEIGRKLMSRAIIDDIISRVSHQREAEAAAAVWMQEEVQHNNPFEFMPPEYEEEE